MNTYFKVIFILSFFVTLIGLIGMFMSKDKFVKKNKNLVFTSAGDNTEFYKNWLGDNRNYDVFVVYYGDDDKNFNKYKSFADKIWRRKGSKFQNFYYLYKNFPKEILNYNAFYIVDDDIIMSTDGINKLFDILYKYKLSICQPSFTNDSKISHKITLQVPGNILRYTNFVEVNTPVFTKDALIKSMKYYDDSLIGWGIDYLYIWANDMNKKDKYAVIDIIPCINPKDDYKKDGRELNKINNYETRHLSWHKLADKYGIPHTWVHKIYSRIISNPFLDGESKPLASLDLATTCLKGTRSAN